MDQSKTDQTKNIKGLNFTIPSCSHLSKCGVWVESGNFYGGETADDAFLVIGFDTEFKTPVAPLTRSDIKDGLGKYEVLSYQFYCKLYDDQQPDAGEWGGICYPAKNERLSMGEVLAQAVSAGIGGKHVRKLPTKIYLVGHFTRADVPAFADFEEITHLLSAVRNTFLSVGDHIPVGFSFPDSSSARLKVIIRDTMLLTPAASKGLSALGELVGQPKLSLDPDPAQDQWYKKNMDVLLREKPALFKEYALNDAVICVRYAAELIDQCDELLGHRRIPATLTGIGVDLLIQAWEDKVGQDWLSLLGQEEKKEKVWNKRYNRYQTLKTTVFFKEVDWHANLASEAYHGGRNEQFWFGPAFEDYWTDYDLSGAYPTAMALIQVPDWRKIHTTTCVEDFTERTLGVADVTFEFPKSVRFPTMPVRTANGLVFPRRGTTACGAPEIALAARLGAKLIINHGVIVPPLNDTTVFGDFIGGCVRNRGQHDKGSFRNLFWKEVSNSSYGKTAQGLRKKRVYDLKDRTTKPLPPSKITNPFFAAYITSFVRAVLGEIMNGLPEAACVFSCTTDGFLTNATASEMKSASQGPLCLLFEASRLELTGDAKFLEIKHVCRQPLGWRTRGQATLIEGDTFKGDDHNIVLAKGGIYTASHMDTVRLRNAYVIERFFERTPESVIQLEVFTGVRDMVEFDTDLVTKSLIRRLNMEFDWKRRPHAVGTHLDRDHVAFSTTPWDTVEEFEAIRGYWDELSSNDPFCVKAQGDFDRFATHVLTKSSLGREASRYLKSVDPDLKRLRQNLGAAWRHSEAGLEWQQDGLSNADFALVLTAAGISAKRSDVENDSKKRFVRNKCPPTPNVLRALRMLKIRFPTLDTSALLASAGAGIDLLTASRTFCPFIDRLNDAPRDQAAA